MHYNQQRSDTNWSDLKSVVSVLFRLVLIILQPFRALWCFIKWRIRSGQLAGKIDGPPALPIFGNVLDVFNMDSAGLLEYGLNQCRKFRPIMCFYMGPMVAVRSCNDRDQELILGGQKHMQKALFYRFLKPWLGDGLLLSTGEKWHARRKILTPAFHFKILEQFIPIFQGCGDIFVNNLRQKVGMESFDVWPMSKLLTLDIICETAMGVQIDSQRNSDSAYANAVNEIGKIILERLRFPWMYMDLIFFKTTLGRKFKKSLDMLHGFTYKVIQQRKSEIENILKEDDKTNIEEIGRRRRVAFLDLLLLTARDGSLSDADIREEVDTFMFEGHDTTAAAISFTLYLLSTDEQIQEKILLELESLVDPSANHLELSMLILSELQYLDKVIKESLRIYPPVGFFGRHISEEVTLPSKSTTLPTYSTYVVSLMCIHSDPEKYPDPMKFDPERFAVDECARRDPFDYLPFSAGPRNCIGQRFAMLEMKSIIAKVVWNFRILPEPGFRPILIWELIFKSQNGLRIRLEERKRK